MTAHEPHTGWSGPLARTLARVATAAGVLCLPVLLLDSGGIVPKVQAGLPVVGLLGLVVAAFALLAKARWSALVALLAALALMAPVLPLKPRPKHAPDGPVLTIVTINVQYGRADAAAIVDQVRLREADVLVILEATPGHWQRLGDAGLGELLPHATGTANSSAAGTIVATRKPVTCLDESLTCGRVVERDTNEDEPFTQVDVRLADGTVLRGAHPVPPTSPQWRDSLGRLERWVHEAQAGEPRLVVTGDFNASGSHPAFRRVAKGMDQSPRAWPWLPTWPQEGRVPAFVQIDHTLSRGFAIEGEGRFIIPGTDHAGIWVMLGSVA